MRVPFFRREVPPCCFVVGLFLATLLALLVGGTAGYLARAPLLGAFGKWWVVYEALVKADAPRIHQIPRHFVGYSPSE